MNHVRTCRGHVHEPVRTLVNTLISFRVPRKRKEMQANPNQRASRRRRDKRVGPQHGEIDGLPRQCSHWLAMTRVVRPAAGGTRGWIQARREGRRATARVAPTEILSHIPRSRTSPTTAKRSGFCRSFSCYSLFPYLHTSSPFSTSTVMVAPGARSPRRLVRATRGSTPLCSTRRRGRAP